MKLFYILVFKSVIILSFFLSTATFAQESGCEPSLTSVDGDGETVLYYGDYIRKYQIISDDKSEYSLYIANSKQGTFVFVQLRENINAATYQNAVNNFLNQNSLKTSTLSLTINKDGVLNTFEFKAMDCSHQTHKLLGSVTSFTATFLAEISKEQIQLLQTYHLSHFQLNLGGKPYERRFRKANKITTSIKEAISCIDIESIHKTTKLKPKSTELDMTEVGKEQYAATIVGKWIANIEGKDVEIKFSEDSYQVSYMGKVYFKATYKIVSDRFIYSSDTQNGADKIVMFLKDMFIISANGKENTYTRIE